MTDIKPVAWVDDLSRAQPHCVTDLKYCSIGQWDRGEHLKYTPLYTAAALDAAVDEERDRIIAVLRARHEKVKHLHNYYACLAREIQEGTL